MRAILPVVVAAAMSFTPHLVAAQPVTFDFVLEVTHISVNSSSNPVAIGDHIAGRMTINLKQTEALPPAYYRTTVYDVFRGSTITIDINCHRAAERIDGIWVLNDAAPAGNPITYIDRFFVNAGDVTVGGEGGIQFWIDERNAAPTLLTSQDIPTEPLDLSKSDSTTFVYRTLELDFQAHFVTFTDKGRIKKNC